MLTAVLIFLATITLVIWQPRGLGIGWSAMGGAIVALLAGAIEPFGAVQEMAPGRGGDAARREGRHLLVVWFDLLELNGARQRRPALTESFTSLHANCVVLRGFK